MNEMIKMEDKKELKYGFRDKLVRLLKLSREYNTMDFYKLEENIEKGIEEIKLKIEELKVFLKDYELSLELLIYLKKEDEKIFGDKK